MLLLAYRFPPMGGVGTRRWAKFSKYLARDGIGLNVIAVEYGLTDRVTWLRDIQNSDIVVHRLRSNLPSWYIKKENKSLPHRLLSAFYRRVFRRSKIDDSDGWESELIPFARDFIRNGGVRNVVVTGPPVTMFYWGSLLKRENKNIRLILDYRDPWNSDRDYQFQDPALKSRSMQMENDAVQMADKIVVVSKDMENDLTRDFPSQSGKISTIHTGYDPEDYPSSVQPKGDKASFSMVYAGAIWKNRNLRARALELLAETLASSKDSFLKENLKIILYSDLEAWFFKKSPWFTTFQSNFKFHEMVSPSHIPGILQSHSYCLSINSPPDAYAFSSKVFDYMGLGKKIFHISNGGGLSALLKKKGQFVSEYNVGSIMDGLRQMKDDYQSGNFRPVEYPEFNIRHSVTQYKDLLA